MFLPEMCKRNIARTKRGDKVCSLIPYEKGKHAITLACLGFFPKEIIKPRIFMKKVCQKNPPQTPPYYYMEQIADHCPKAIQTYMHLWRDKDEENRVIISKENISIDYLIAPAKFKHDLLMLVKEGLISIDEYPKYLNIELVGWEDDQEDDEGKYAC